MTHSALPTRILVTIQRPGLWLLSLAVFVALMALLIWSAYLYGQRVAGYERGEAVSVIGNLEKQLKEIQALYAESQHQTAMIERTSQIDDDASKQLKQALNEAQQESLTLKKELAFYKSIVSPEQDKRSLAIQTIQLKQEDGGDYRYKVMVSQRGRNDKLARGTIDIKLEGVDAGQARTLALSEVSPNVKKVTKFGFKYFQNFEGTLSLPTTFTPENLRVVVTPSNNAIDKLDEQYSWVDLTSGGN
ncbi:MAG: DUF6776 family protein [Gammaproteobacteria bacterium]